MTDTETPDISIWEKLNPEEGFTEEHLRYLESLDIGELPPMDETFVKFSDSRAEAKRSYMNLELGISPIEAAALSRWKKGKLQKEKAKWSKGEGKAPIATEIMYDVISTYQVWRDIPEKNTEAKELLLEQLNHGWRARLDKRIERQIEVVPGISLYKFKKQAGSATLPGSDHIPERTLVETLKTLEAALIKRKEQSQRSS